jgi:hypothetical protein
MVPSFIFVNSPLIMLFTFAFVYLLATTTYTESKRKEEEGELKNEFTRKQEYSITSPAGIPDTANSHRHLFIALTARFLKEPG